MRPSNSPEAVVVLNKRPELRIVEDALENSAISTDIVPLSDEDCTTDIRTRFIHQTRVLPAERKADTEFNVLPEDALLISNAALQVVMERSVGGRAKNIITGRRSAALNILDAVKTNR